MEGVHRWELAPVKRPLEDSILPPQTAESSPIGFRKTDEPYR